MVLIFLLVITITLVIGYYIQQEKNTEQVDCFNYDILHHLVEAFVPSDVNATTNIEYKAYIDFGKDLHNHNLNRFVNRFLNHVSQKTCNKDAEVKFPLEFTEETKYTVIDDLSLYLDKLSINTVQLLSEAKTRREFNNCKNILVVLAFMKFKSTTYIDQLEFINYYPSTRRVNILDDQVKHNLFGNDYAYNSSLIELNFFRELLLNYAYNENKRENYINHYVQDSIYNVELENGKKQYFVDNFAEYFETNLQTIYEANCEKDPANQQACLVPFENYYSNVDPSTFLLPEVTEITEEVKQEFLQSAEYNYDIKVENSTC